MQVKNDLFTRDPEGRVTRLESFFILSPERENGHQMLFGGKVLEMIDEVSGSLATLFVARDQHQAVHAGEEVLFLQPIRTGEVGKVVATVVYATEKIVCVHVVVYGGPPQDPGAFTKRYEGFGMCAVITTASGTMARDLTPYDAGTAIASIARDAVTFQRDLRKRLIAAAGEGEAT